MSNHKELQHIPVSGLPGHKNVRKAIAELLEPITNPELQHIPVTKPKRTSEGPTEPPLDSAALQFALYCVQREIERLGHTSIIDPMASRAMAELERLISTA